VVENTTGTLRKFMHGRIIHGAQSTRPAFRELPLAYFHPEGPVGDVFLRACAGENAKSHVAVVGQGIGAMAAYAQPGQHFTFYEIDPEVDEIARNDKLFTFLADCQGTYDVVLGDGRLTLADAPDKRYGLIFLDAFSSDAVPTHLLTREALAVYLSKLDDGGMLVFNISNKYLNLRPLLGNLAADAGLTCMVRDDRNVSEEDQARGRLGSQYVAMARRLRDMAALTSLPDWKPVFHDPRAPIWTDQFSNILSAVTGG
jgi:hypothetical protein